MTLLIQRIGTSMTQMHTSDIDISLGQLCSTSSISSLEESTCAWSSMDSSVLRPCR